MPTTATTKPATKSAAAPLWRYARARCPGYTDEWDNYSLRTPLVEILVSGPTSDGGWDWFLSFEARPDDLLAQGHARTLEQGKARAIAAARRVLDRALVQLGTEVQPC